MGPWIWGRYGDGEEETVNLCSRDAALLSATLSPRVEGDGTQCWADFVFVDSNNPLIPMMGKVWWAELTVFTYLLVC